MKENNYYNNKNNQSNNNKYRQINIIFNAELRIK